MVTQPEQISQYNYRMHPLVALTAPGQMFGTWQQHWLTWTLTGNSAMLPYLHHNIGTRRCWQGSSMSDGFSLALHSRQQLLH